MPKQLKEIKDFVIMVRANKDIKQIRIKKTKKITKFKVRTGYVPITSLPAYIIFHFVFYLFSSGISTQKLIQRQQYWSLIISSVRLLSPHLTLIFASAIITTEDASTLLSLTTPRRFNNCAEPCLRASSLMSMLSTKHHQNDKWKGSLCPIHYFPNIIYTHQLRLAYENCSCGRLWIFLRPN